ncbi:MAG: restriction endonuclease subunit S, partial [Selenomonadaceae bacterium]|nr:restriction endonuclease subunit S [Selenomonadaceae bacterium]
MFWLQAQRFMARRTLLRRLKIFAAKKLFITTTTMTTLTEKIWQEFFIEEIFNILPGKRLTKADMIAGDTPFIGASDSNNGVTCFVGNDNDSADENFLSVSYNGSVCQCFYHPYRCLCSDDVKRFHLKNRAGNKYIYLFMKSIIEKQRGKYNYGYKFNETRMRRQKIMLPVNDKGEPDYNFMENYVRVVEEKQLQRYRDYVQALDAAKIPPLNEKIWRPFFVSDLFRLEMGKSKGLNHLEQDEQGISYLGATNRNNGVLTFVKPVENLIQRGNCIAFIRNGEGSIGYSIYKREDFIATSDIT